MPKEIWPDDFCCPKCGKTPHYRSAIGARCYSARRLDMPYLMCPDCRVCSYSKLLLRQTISRWGKDNASRMFPYAYIYRESKKTLEEVLAYYIRTAGYRLGRFKLKTTKPTT